MAITFQIENSKGQKGNVSQKVALGFLENENRYRPLYFIIKRNDKRDVEGEVTNDKIILYRYDDYFQKTFPQVVLRNTSKDVKHKVLLTKLNFEIEDCLEELMIGLGIEPKVPREKNGHFVAYDFTRILREPVVEHKE